MANISKTKRIFILSALVVIFLMTMAFSAFADSYTVPASTTADQDGAVTLTVGNTSTNQITIVVRKNDDNWLTDPNANVLFIDQVTGQGASTNIEFAIDTTKFTGGTYKVFVGGSGMDVASGDLVVQGEGTQVTVTFKDKDGNVIDTKTLAQGGTLTDIPTVPAGNQGSWYDEATNLPAVFTNIQGNMSVKAHYEPITTHTVTFKDIDGTTTLDTKTVNDGATVTPPTVTPPAGKAAKWLDGSAAAVFTNITSDKTFVLSWVDVSNVTFTITKDYLTNLGQTGKDLIEGTLSADNGTIKVATASGVELLYSEERHKYVGLVSTTDIASGALVTPTITAGTLPTKFTYVDLNSDAKKDATDLLIMKNTLTKGSVPKTILAAELNGDGKIDATDLLIIKNVLTKGSIPSILNK